MRAVSVVTRTASRRYAWSEGRRWRPAAVVAAGPGEADQPQPSLSNCTTTSDPTIVMWEV
jgi:hypothetical protein